MKKIVVLLALTYLLASALPNVTLASSANTDVDSILKESNDYGNYYVNITDVSVTARVNTPAWLVSKAATIVSNTRSKGDFVMQDPVGSFSVILLTDITPGPYSVTIKHTALN